MFVLSKVAGLLRMTALFALLTASSARGRCRIKCGIIDEQTTVSGQAESGSTFDLVSTVWNRVTTSRQYSADIEATFMRIEPRYGVTVDNVIETYMEIGTLNVSTVIGRYLTNVAMTTNKFHVPYFVTSAIDSDPTDLLSRYNVVAVLPVEFQLHSVTFDLIQKLGWSSVVILYSTIYANSTNLIELLTLRSPDVAIHAWKIEDDVSTEHLRNVLSTIRQEAHSQIVIMTTHILTYRVLRQAIGLSLLTEKYVWILALLTHEHVDLLNFTDAGARILSYRIVQRHRHLATDFDRDLIGQHSTARDELLTATVHDSLLTIYQCAELRFRATSGASCDCMTSLNDLLPILTNVRLDGVTGPIYFDNSGTRRGHVIEIIRIVSNGTRQVAQWNSSLSNTAKAVKIFDESQVTPQNYVSSYPLGTETLRILVSLEEPFVMERNESRHFVGPNANRFEGIFVDFIRELSDIVNFRYELIAVNKMAATRGRQSRDTRWNELVERLTTSGEADMAICTMGMTSPLIHFSAPFYKTELFGLISTRSVSVPSTTYWLLTQPFSPVVWITLTTSAIVFLTAVCVINHVMCHRIRLKELTNQQHRYYDKDQDNQSCNVTSSLVRGQTQDTTVKLKRMIPAVPESVTGRLLSYSLRFLVIVVMATYTANMAATLTSKHFDPYEHSNGRLLKLRDITATGNDLRYGTVGTSDVIDLLEQSVRPWLRQVWLRMTSSDETVENIDDGLRRIDRDESYVLLWHRPGLQYKTAGLNMDCVTSLIQLDGEETHVLIYGIAVPLTNHRLAVSGRHIVDTLNRAMIQLHQRSYFNELDKKWWGNRHCLKPVSRVQKVNTSLTVDDTWQLFVAVATVALVSLVVGIIELSVVRRRKTTHRSSLTKLDDETAVDRSVSTQHRQILLSQTPKLKFDDCTANNFGNSPAQRTRTSCFKSNNTKSTECTTSTIVTGRQTQIF